MVLETYRLLVATSCIMAGITVNKFYTPLVDLRRQGRLKFRQMSIRLAKIGLYQNQSKTTSAEREIGWKWKLLSGFNRCIF